MAGSVDETGDMGGDCDGGKRIVQLIQSGGASPPGTPWRTARCSAIQRRCAGAQLDEFAYVAYTLAHFGAADLAQLSDSQLEQTYHHVMAMPTR